MADAPLVHDQDLVAGGVETEIDFEAWPFGGNARCQEQELALAADTQDALDPGSIEPARRARVPGPSAAALVRRCGVNVGGHSVWLDFVALHVGPRAAALDRIRHSEQRDGFLALSEGGESENRPGHRVRVLTAVFPDAGRIAADVTGIERR